MPKPGYRDSELGEIPLEWSVVRLSELGRWGGGGTPSKSKAEYWTNGSIPWVSPKDMGPKLIDSSIDSITENAVKESATNLYPEKTLLMVTRSGVLRHTFPISLTKRPVTINQDLKALVVKSPRDAEFYFHVLTWRSQDILKNCRKAGTTVESIDTPSLLGYLVSSPTIGEREKIASILSSIDTTLERSRAVLEQVEEVRRAVMQELMTRGIPGRNREFHKTELGFIPQEWKCLQMREICNHMGVGIASSTTHAYADVQDGIPILRNLNIKVGFIDEADLLYINRQFDQQNASKRIQTGDIVTVRTGYPGLSAVVSSRFQNCQTFTTLISRPKQNVVMPEFLCQWINSDQGKKFILAGQAGGAQQNLNVGTFEKMFVAIPPIKEQQEIMSAIKALDRRSNCEYDKISQLERIKLDLMHLLLTGQKRVNV